MQIIASAGSGKNNGNRTIQNSGASGSKDQEKTRPSWSRVGASQGTASNFDHVSHHRRNRAGADLNSVPIW